MKMNTKVIQYDEGEPFPEEMPLECIQAYGLDPNISYTRVFEPTDNNQVVFRKQDGNNSLYYIRFTEIINNIVCADCGSTNARCGCRCCMVRECTVYLYNFVVSTSVICLEFAKMVYILAMNESYRSLHKHAAWLEKKSNTILITAKVLCGYLSYHLQIPDTLDVILSFII
jgi:hypothetical protein